MRSSDQPLASKGAYCARVMIQFATSELLSYKIYYEAIPPPIPPRLGYEMVVFGLNGAQAQDHELPPPLGLPVDLIRSALPLLVLGPPKGGTHEEAPPLASHCDCHYVDHPHKAARQLILMAPSPHKPPTRRLICRLRPPSLYCPVSRPQ